jgi:ADP-heptose:LPS heptosyltransferase
VAGPAAPDLLARNPAVDRIITYRAPWHEAWRGGRVDWREEAARFWRATRELRKERYDVGFELRGDPRDIAFLAFTRPRVLVGSGLRGGAQALDYSMPLDWWSGHQVTNVAAIACAGMPPPSTVHPPRLHLSEPARRRARELVPEPAIGLHLGAGFPSKQLPLQSFARVIRSLRCRGLAQRFVVVGGAGEQGLAAALGEPVCDLTGKLSLQETAAVLERCSVFIGNDSGPMHLAAAVGTPVVACFGPSETWRFHPYGVEHRIIEVPLECRPCDYVHCVFSEGQKYQCMARQDPDVIVDATAALLRRAR